MRKLTRLISSIAVLLVLTNTPALAADPDPMANHVLADFIKSGVKVYFMGQEQGFNGWFLAKDNQVQLGYTSLDNQSFLIGVLFNASGDDISTKQVKALYDNNKEVNAYLNSINNSQTPGSAGVPGMRGFGATGVTPAPLNTYSSLVPAAPGERLVQALQNAAGVDVGAPTAPKLYMIADPNCPHCQATWKMLRTALFGGKLQIRLVPIAAATPDSERAAAQFLRAPDPLDTWDKYVAGDQTKLAGEPDMTLLAAVRDNHALVDAWHIQMTPYLVYRAKDHTIKIIQGEPEHPDDLINDIAP